MAKSIPNLKWTILFRKKRSFLKPKKKDLVKTKAEDKKRGTELIKMTELKKALQVELQKKSFDAINQTVAFFFSLSDFH